MQIFQLPGLAALRCRIDVNAIYALVPRSVWHPVFRRFTSSVHQLILAGLLPVGPEAVHLSGSFVHAEGRLNSDHDQHDHRKEILNGVHPGIPAEEAERQGNEIAGEKSG